MSSIMFNKSFLNGKRCIKCKLYNYKDAYLLRTLCKKREQNLWQVKIAAWSPRNHKVRTNIIISPVSCPPSFHLWHENI